MKEIKKNRVFSFGVICGTYLLAILFGCLIANMMTGEIWVNVLVGNLVATMIIFFSSCIFGNPSVYGLYRSVSPIVTVLGLVIGEGFSFLRLLLIIAVLAWGIRLSINWTGRFENLKAEDWRFRRFRKMFGSSYPIINLLGVHLIPTMLTYCCMLPIIGVFSVDASFSIITVIFFLVALVGVFIEGYSDYHMNLFRKDVADGYETGCCNYGLWRNARHPNYLGEIIFWWAIYFAVLCSLPSKWYLFFGALLNTFVFMFISGPLADKHLADKPGWNRYRKRTYMLVPFPKTSGR